MIKIESKFAEVIKSEKDYVAGVKKELEEARAANKKHSDEFMVMIPQESALKKESYEIQELEKRIRKRANKKIFETTGVRIPISKARDELYCELKNIWYGKAV